MISASIICGVADRIRRLFHELTDSQRLLLREMESIINLLNAADLVTKKSRHFVNFEKWLVQLSYAAANVVELRILPRPIPRPRSRPRFQIFFRCYATIDDLPDLETVTTHLIHMKGVLDHIVRESPYSRSQGRGGVNGWRVDVAVAAGAVEQEVIESLRASVPAVCIYGDRGMGKTTLAKKVLDDARSAGDQFEGFAWVRVNKECKPRKVFEEMLQELDPAQNRAEISGMDQLEMIQRILIIQREKRCLIVLDEIWAVNDWNNIRSALLVYGSISRTLITTSSREVFDMVRTNGRVCKLKPLNREEIFSLLREKASFNDHELHEYGNIISSVSEGSPLFAVALGKSFKAADERAMTELVNELDTYRNRSENQVFEVCYDILSNELKLCWIYMGQFPEGQDIQVEKLQLLLEADGIMPPDDNGTRWNNQIRLQSIRDLLQKLAQRKLVKLQEDRASMCQLHPLVRSFCISKGRENELFEIAEAENGREVVINIEPSTRRLAVHLTDANDCRAITFTPRETADKIRSILIFDTLGSETRSKITGLHQLSSLRVLDFHGVDFRVRKKVLKGISNLVLLRYLGFGGCFLTSLPSSVSRLQMLETLDLRVRSDCCLNIPSNVVSNMKRLRNLYFPLLYETRDNTKLRLCGLERLKTLVHFHAQVCEADDLRQLTSLQILTAISEEDHQGLATIVEISNSRLQQTSFIVKNIDISIREREVVFNNMLECRSLQSLRIQGPHIREFPSGPAISPNLSEIVFDGCEIQGNPTPVLQSLGNLQSVVISNNAFVGGNMSIVFSSDCCPNLRSLKILNLQNLKVVEFQIGSVPNLSTLVVENCTELGRILMPRALDDWLQAERRKKGMDVYSVSLNPTIIDQRLMLLRPEFQMSVVE